MGLDFAAKDGTPIYAAQGGTVAYIGRADGFGQWIVIDHPAEDGSGTTVYGHMWNAFATGLKAGQRVEAGQLIAYVGSNGQSSGPHLHFEVHPTVWRAGSQIDPKSWLAGASEPETATPATEVKTVGWTGDPSWLADVLIDELGSKRVKVMSGWDQRGHGDFKDIRGVMFHHTGNGAATPESIRDGRPDLPGPLSNVHVSQKGIVTVVAVGVCWHAGIGSYPWLPTNMGNWHLIGMECAWPRDTSINESTAGRERWPDAEIIAIRDTAAACLRKLLFGSDRVIGHKEYAGRAQGKWDPGNVDMGWFRGEVAKDLAGFQFLGEGSADYTPMPIPAPVPAADAHSNVLLYRGMVSPDVAKLQTLLKRFYSKLVVDGIFGERTEECVKDFQASKWRRPPLAVDGIVGPATAAQLGLTL